MSINYNDIINYINNDLLNYKLINHSKLENGDLVGGLDDDENGFYKIIEDSGHVIKNFSIIFVAIIILVYKYYYDIKFQEGTESMLSLIDEENKLNPYPGRPEVIKILNDDYETNTNISKI